jgi:aspartyl-tRNA(Asn)/glutamyl-tRNA(Gln) amidotransferase subunit B
VSVRRSSNDAFGTRCEIKNVNSMKNLMRAIEFEAARQVEILENGGVVDQETRLFDAGTGETRTMRSKEDAMDYRYFPDPDLLPLELSDEFIANIKKTLPELPDAKKSRYIATLSLSPYDATILTSDRLTADFYEAVIAKVKDGKMAANWITSELFGRLGKLGLEIENSPVSADKMIGLLKLIEDNTISGKIAKDVLDFMIESGKDAAAIVEEKGLKQVTDMGAIEKIIDEVLAANQDKVAEYKSGKDKLFAFFVGQVMKASAGKANPAALNELLKKKLG